MLYQNDQWMKHVFQRQDPGDAAQVPEQVGDYFYFSRTKNLPMNVKTGQPAG